MKLRRWHPFLIPTILLLGCERLADQSTSNQKRFDPSKSDPQAVRIADEVMVAMGGRKNYEAVQYLSFRFVVEADSQIVADRRHAWNRRTNDYRLESVSRDGEHTLAIFNLDTKKGVVFKNGQPANDEEKAQLLTRAYARFINDTYWLLMPFKLKDPGAVLKYDGEQEINEVHYDILRLSFADSVGLTPWNVYRVFVDQATRVVHRWEYFEREGANPTPCWWEHWRFFNGIKLAELRTFEHSNRRIRFLDIVVSNKVSEKIFEVSTSSKASMF
ncbi:MAG: hypothetical protein ONA90_05255 [candidate division KSB1 bacterium]|nr:hypothetical protein [candidate division KSB1 bacterium]